MLNTTNLVTNQRLNGEKVKGKARTLTHKRVMDSFKVVSDFIHIAQTDGLYTFSNKFNYPTSFALLSCMLCQIGISSS